MLLASSRSLGFREWLMSQPSLSAAAGESERAVICGMTRVGATGYQNGNRNQTRDQPAV
jgi:hypothetical protein